MSKKQKDKNPLDEIDRASVDSLTYEFKMLFSLYVSQGQDPLEEEKLSYKKSIDAAKLAQQQRIQNQRTAVQRERLNASKKR